MTKCIIFVCVCLRTFCRCRWTESSPKIKRDKKKGEDNRKTESDGDTKASSDSTWHALVDSDDSAITESCLRLLGFIRSSTGCCLFNGPDGHNV